MPDAFSLARRVFYLVSKYTICKNLNIDVAYSVIDSGIDQNEIFKNQTVTSNFRIIRGPLDQLAASLVVQSVCVCD